jgi:hypothetical protein
MTLSLLGMLCLCVVLSVYLDRRARSTHMDWPDLLRRMDRLNPRRVRPTYAVKSHRASTGTPRGVAIADASLCATGGSASTKAVDRQRRTI